MNFTFVDCPGHQSLMKTVIGGSQIIDMMLLVVDINKGFQTQTAECLILAEITRKPLLIVLNKIDTINEDKRKDLIEKMSSKVKKVIDKTEFKGCELVPVSATTRENIDLLIFTMMKYVAEIDLTRDIKSPFIFAFDHCFLIKGSGSVLSGTILQGTVKVNDSILFPMISEERKVKSMQKFRKPVTNASAGDRVAICVTNFNTQNVERGLLCQQKNSLQVTYAVIIKLNKVEYFKRQIETRMKFHCSVGHETTIGKILLFSSDDNSDFDCNSSYSYEDNYDYESSNSKHFFCLIEFNNPVITYENMLLIASKLDTEDSKVCRIAFHGKIKVLNSSSDKNYAETFLHRLKIHKTKSKEGFVQRYVNEREVIVADLFKKDSDLTKFVNMKCELSTGETGMIIGAFGKSAKVRVQFRESLSENTISLLKQLKNDVKVRLCYKKLIFEKNDNKRIFQ